MIWRSGLMKNTIVHLFNKVSGNIHFVSNAKNFEDVFLQASGVCEDLNHVYDIYLVGDIDQHTYDVWEKWFMLKVIE